jgi:hypothetical protein
MEGASLLTRVLTAAAWWPGGAATGDYAAFTAWAKMSAAAASAVRITWAYTRRVIAGPAWPSRAATTWTGTPESSGVVAWICRKSCSRAWGSWSLGFGPFWGSLWARVSLVISEVTVSG